MPLDKTDRLMIAQAAIAKAESHDPDRQVGAVIAGPTGRPLATGANRPPEAMGFTRRESHEAIAADPDWKYFMLEHAERNAIAHARALGHTLDGAAIYVTLFPCADCARAIAASGIKRLVAPLPKILSASDEKWRLHFKYALEIFAAAGVEIEPVPTVEDLADTKPHPVVARRQAGSRRR